MDRLHKYLVSLVNDRFYGSIKITFEDGLPVSIREEKSIDTAPFKEEIRESLRKDSPGKNN
ncbi:MAG TPA: hypothetical protein DCL49_04180 [Candidatus Omnitrophica bacterium]|nr:hypothetical protein [Candidatus Omnitrophota bacterium]HBG63124.1 hypothetical protein [Candidatus Omnitrophota bacterium]